MSTRFLAVRDILNTLGKDQILDVLQQAFDDSEKSAQWLERIRRAALDIRGKQQSEDESGNAARGCCLSYLARQDDPSALTFVDCTEDDKYFLDHPHKPQFLFLKFPRLLDPSLLCSSLYSTLQIYPRASSRIVGQEDGRKFQLGAERCCLTAVKVSENILEDLSTLSWVTTTLQRSLNPAAPPLLQAYLLRSPDSSQGCVLLVGFHHVLGDVMSYASFVSSWSSLYQQAVERRARLEEEDRALLELEGCLSYPGPSPGFSSRILQFVFHRSELEERRSRMRETDLRLSINDVLMAECACALARTRCAGQVRTRIAVLVDMRGRCLGQEAWGNHVVDFHILLDVQDLYDDNVPAVARQIRGCVEEQTAELRKGRRVLEEKSRERAEVPRLLCWNSWVKAGSLLLSSHFGSPQGLSDFRWLNSMAVEDRNIAMVLPLVDPPDALAVQLCLDDPSEIDSLGRRWGTGMML